MHWNDLPGVTLVEGRPTLPEDPDLVVAALAIALAGGRQGSLTRTELVERVRASHGGDRARLHGLAAWLGESRVAVWREDGTLDVHPGTHLQDVAFRLCAWAGTRPVATEHVDALKKWVRAVMQRATSHPDALRRETRDEEVCRLWVQGHTPPPPVDPGPLPDDPLRARLRRILAALDGALLERRTHLRAVLLALLAGQHALLLGPPGTAKSLLARALCQVFEDARYFEYLLSRFTHPDELFGPVSIPGLKDEDYRRLTEGFLPQAHVAFLDEIFKANSAILNSLLTLVNERVFHHGRHRDPAPLLGLVGASNELPAPDGGLDALYDRFLVRLAVPPLGDPGNFVRMATGDLSAPHIDPADRLTLDDVAAIRARAARVTVPDTVRDALGSLWQHAREAGWPVSDRRWRQAVDLLKVAAATDGRDQVHGVDLLLLEPCLAWDPTESAQVRAALMEHLEPGAVPGNDLDVQWSLLWSDRVAPTVADPVPPGDPPTDWRGRTARRRAALERFLVHHETAVANLAADRDTLESEGREHLWLSGLPAELLMPHIEATRALAKALRKTELHLARIHSPATLAESVVAWLITEERVRPEHMDAVIDIGGTTAVGLSYRQWRRLKDPVQGAATITVDAEEFLDWLGGARSTSSLLSGLDARSRRALDSALPALHDTLAPRLLPEPGDLGG